MNIRNYNIYFHTHTISGIIIAALLYVIFFAGSFSFFKEDISAWQSSVSAKETSGASLNYGKLLDSLDKKYDLKGRNLTLYLYQDRPHAYVSLEASKDTVNNLKAKQTAYFDYDLKRDKESTYAESYDLGEFLYRLHFLAQLNQALPFNIGYPLGYVIAGLVAFLFVFALITGLLLHWDKLVSNFYQFRFRAKWKTVWTDLHTVLGVIGFPFQFVFAFTGAILIINSVLLLPFGQIVYKGNMDQVYQELEYTLPMDPIFVNKPLTEKPDIQAYVDNAQRKWPKAPITRVTIKNYGDASMLLGLESEADQRERFAGTGRLIYEVNTHRVLKEQAPSDRPSYVATMKGILYHLHFGDYGGYFVRITNFILGIMGCVVIASGIMIWLVARDKNNVPSHKRKFNFWLSNIFLSVCLSMFPVTAFSFIAIKVLGKADQTLIYQVYFYSWLLVSLYYIARRKLRRTNRETLLIGAILAVGVPLSNGLVSQNWLWHTWNRGATDIFFIDLLWLVLAGLAGVAYVKTKKPREQVKTILCLT